MKLIDTVKQTIISQRNRMRKDVEEAENGKRSSRQLSLKLLAGFFAIMFLFTLFSRAADALTIAQVQVSGAKRNTINHEINTEGTVEAMGRHSLAALSGLELLLVPVKQGTRVVTGDTLAKFTKEDADYLLQKLQNELASLRLNQQTAEEDDTPLMTAERTLNNAKLDMETELSESALKAERANEAYDKAYAEYQRIYRKNKELVGSQYELAWTDNTDDEYLWEDSDDDEERAVRKAKIRSALDELKSAWSAFKEKEIALQNTLKDGEQQRIRLDRAVSDAQLSYDKIKRESAEGNAAADLKQNDLALTIKEKEKEIGKLKEIIQNDYSLKSPIDGVVVSVKGESGTITDGKEILSVAENKENCQLKAKISKEQTKWIKTGDKVTVSLMSNGERVSIEVAVSSISLQEDENDRYELTLNLPEKGAYLIGETASVSFEKQSESYNATLPLSALRSDNGGDFVYVARKKESVLGDEYTAYRVDIKIRDRDSKNMAIDAAILPEDAVIIGSNRALAAGDRVRMEQSS